MHRPAIYCLTVALALGVASHAQADRVQFAANYISGPAGFTPNISLFNLDYNDGPPSLEYLFEDTSISQFTGIEVVYGPAFPPGGSPLSVTTDGAAGFSTLTATPQDGVLVWGGSLPLPTIPASPLKVVYSNPNGIPTLPSAADLVAGFQEAVQLQPIQTFAFQNGSVIEYQLVGARVLSQDTPIIPSPIAGLAGLVCLGLLTVCRSRRQARGEKGI